MSTPILALALLASSCPNLSGTYLQKTKMGQADLLSIRQESCDELFVAHSQISEDDLDRGVGNLRPEYKMQFLNADRAEFRDQCNDAVDSSCVDNLAEQICRHEQAVPREYCSSTSTYFVQARGSDAEYNGGGTFMFWLTWEYGSAGTVGLDAAGDLRVTNLR
ncbi:MAG: hypothetical protein ACXVCK_09975, partial [Bdellovibrionota bacterium]